MDFYEDEVNGGRREEEREHVNNLGASRNRSKYNDSDSSDEGE